MQEEDGHHIVRFLTGRMYVYDTTWDDASFLRRVGKERGRGGKETASLKMGWGSKRSGGCCTLYRIMYVCVIIIAYTMYQNEK